MIAVKLFWLCSPEEIFMWWPIHANTNMYMWNRCFRKQNLPLLHALFYLLSNVFNLLKECKCWLDNLNSPPANVAKLWWIQNVISIPILSYIIVLRVLPVSEKLAFSLFYEWTKVLPVSETLYIFSLILSPLNPCFSDLDNSGSGSIPSFCR